MLKIGTSQVDITPPLPYPRGGGVNVDRVADTFVDPLCANAILLQTAETRLMIISCDITTFPDDVADELRTQIEQTTGIPRKNIFLSATHNHQTPRFATIWPEPWKKPRDPENRHYVEGILSTLIVVIDGEPNIRIADYEVGCQPGDIIFIPTRIPHFDGSHPPHEKVLRDRDCPLLILFHNELSSSKLSLRMSRSHNDEHTTAAKKYFCIFNHFQNICLL